MKHWQEIKNIFEDVPDSFKDEIFEDIIVTENFKMERILSKGHATPEGQWYDQKQNEWVLLLKGYADLKIRGKKTVIHLAEGDYISIPAHTKHRVVRTSEGEETVWLALFY